MTSQKAEKMIAHASHADIPDDITRLIFKNNINAEWIDSFQTDCEEYKDFEKTLTPDTIRHALRQQYSNPSAERIHEKKRNMLRVKELEIVMKNVKRLKLFMNKYKDDPYLVKKIRFKLDSIIREYYSKGKAKIGFHEGAHPEYIMNSFIYNPWKGEMNFKILRIDGNQVTYQLYRNNSPHGNPNQIGLDAFLKIRIPLKPIGEVYNFFPDREDDDTDASYNEKVDYYLERLMETFAKKPDTEFFSVPIEAAVPASSFPASAASSVRASAASSFFPAADITPKHPLFPTSLQKPLRIMKTAMDELVQKPPKLRNVSSHDGGSRKNMKSTRKQRMYKKSRKSRKCRKSRKSRKSRNSRKH